MKFVIHLGDITNLNTPVQWQNAQNAMRIRCSGVRPRAARSSSGWRRSRLEELPK
jgi:hypothetical protein